MLATRGYIFVLGGGDDDDTDIASVPSIVLVYNEIEMRGSRLICRMLSWAASLEVTICSIRSGRCSFDANFLEVIF